MIEIIKFRFSSRIMILFGIATLVSLSGCVTTNPLIMSVHKKGFLLPESYLYGTPEKKLHAGRYICYYADKKGEYYEAPSTSRTGSVFSGKVKGGVYLSKGDPTVAYIYMQNNQINGYYAYNVGWIQSGGDGSFQIKSKLPPNFLEAIELFTFE